jgi:hypothetical protein
VRALVCRGGFNPPKHTHKTSRLATSCKLLAYSNVLQQYRHLSIILVCEFTTFYCYCFTIALILCHSSHLSIVNNSSVSVIEIVFIRFIFNLLVNKIRQGWFLVVKCFFHIPFKMYERFLEKQSIDQIVTRAKLQNVILKQKLIFLRYALMKGHSILIFRLNKKNSDRMFSIVTTCKMFITDLLMRNEIHKPFIVQT